MKEKEFSISNLFLGNIAEGAIETQFQEACMEIISAYNNPNVNTDKDASIIFIIKIAPIKDRQGKVSSLSFKIEDKKLKLPPMFGAETTLLIGVEDGQCLAKEIRQMNIDENLDKELNQIKKETDKVWME
ncbi:MAG: hypothetical protein V1838_04180 [Patescibacteria group bacterium]